jgi:hypothetical protein
VRDERAPSLSLKRLRDERGSTRAAEGGQQAERGEESLREERRG